MTPIFELCDDYVTRYAELDPIDAQFMGLTGDYDAGTDYSPDGHEARAELTRTTLRTLSGLTATSRTDRRAAGYLRERLEVDLACHDAGEYLRTVRAPFGQLQLVHSSVDLLPHEHDEHWRDVAARLAAIPAMLAGWRVSLGTALHRGMSSARRQVLETAAQAERNVGSHDALVRSYGDGPLAGELADAANDAYQAYAETARYLREDYAPQATEVDAVGADRYALAARLNLGMDLDAVDAYEWGWAELARIEDELAKEADAVKSGATVDEAVALLDETRFAADEDAYLDWLRQRHAWAIEQLHGRHFDIAEPLRTVDVALARDSTAGSPWYTNPSEDLRRPGRTWWPVGGRSRFSTWNELTTVFHEGVPGHHLQIGATMLAGDTLSRFSKLTGINGHAEGWALYAERLADELGWFEEPGSRLGMLAGSALRAARVVIDIGVHLDLPLPDGRRWNFDTACAVLRDRGRAAPHRVHPEVVRYFGWPGQAISYKLGERAWLAAREDARRQPGFDLKRWHTTALDLGPIGLDRLAGEVNQP